MKCELARLQYYYHRLLRRTLHRSVRYSASYILDCFK